MVAKKEDTPLRISRRKYEEKRKKERRESNGNFQTMIPREDFDKMCAFLKENRLTKVQLIYAGFYALREQQEQLKKLNN